MATVYASGIVTSKPELTHNEKGTAKLLFRVREDREWNGKTYTTEFVVEMWGERAEQAASLVREGAVVEKLKGDPRAEVRFGADGKPCGLLVVKVFSLDLAYSPEPEPQEQADEDDPFGDQ